MTGPGAQVEDLVRWASFALDVEVRGSADPALGTGFLVAPGIVATCAHVLAETRAQLPRTVRARPFATRQVLVLETVPGWYLRGDDGGGLDLAFLRGPEDLGLGHVLLSGVVGDSRPKIGDSLWAFGYPAGMFRNGQSALFIYQGPSRLQAVDEVGRAVGGPWGLGRVVGPPVGGGYSGSAVLNRRTGAVVGMLCTSNEVGSAHYVSSANIIAGSREVARAQSGVVGHAVWLGTLDDEQIRIGGWPFPGPRLRTYLDTAVRVARSHPYPGVLPDARPPPLTAVYLRQQVLIAASRSADSGLDDGADKVRITLSAPIPAEEILGGDEDCVVVAGPGGGKSSLLRTGLITEAERWQRGGVGRWIPVRVLAADLVAPLPLPEAIAAGVTADLSAVGICEGWPAEFFKVKPLRAVRWLVLVDGLDEISDSQARSGVLAKLAGVALGDRPSPYRFVVATRPLPAGELDPDPSSGWAARHYELQPFALDDLDGFAERWFTALALTEPRQAAVAFTAELTRTRLSDLARTPLMATMLCQLFAAHPDRPLPAGRAGVYQRFVELLRERQVTVGVYAQMGSALGQYGPTAAAAATRVLGDSPELISRLAAARHGGNTTPAVDLLTAWTGTHQPPQIPGNVWAAFLGEVLRRSGLLVERADDFAFLHQTITEYLAAKHTAADEQASAAAFHEVFGSWSKPLLHWSPRRRTWSRTWLRARRTWSEPKLDESYIGFLVAAWQERSDLTPALRRLVSRGGLGGCLFIAARVREGTPLDRTVVTSAATTIAAFAADPALDGYVRREAADALAGLGDARGADLLAALAAAPALDGYVRREAADALAGLGDARGADLLAALAADPAVTGGVRREAAVALAGLGDARNADLLAALAADPALDGYARREAADALAGLGDARGADLLAALAADPAVTGGARREAADALAGLGDARGADLLAALAADPALDGYVRREAAVALAGLGDARNADLLAALAADPALDGYARREAADALAGLGDARGADLLAALAADPAVTGGARREAAIALAGLGDARGADLLAALAADPALDGGARREAAEELKRFRRKRRAR